MYNHNRKNEFAIFYASKRSKWTKVRDSTYAVVCSRFQKLQAIEEELGMDVCEFNVNDMQRAFNLISGTQSSTATVVYSTLKSYIKWCKDAGFRVSDAIFEIRIDDIEKIRARMVSSPAHLKMILDEVFNSPDKNQINYIYRAFLWLIFIGYQDYEAVKLLSADVDLLTMRIRPSSTELHACDIYVESLEDLRMASTLPSLIDSSRGKKTPVLVQRAPGDFLLRGAISKTERKTDDLLKDLRPPISRAFKDARETYEGKEIPRTLSLWITPHRLYLSGMFYRAYEKERMGYEVPLWKEFLNDYDNWKSAFSTY